MIYSDKGKHLFKDIPDTVIRKKKSQYETVVACNSSIIKSTDTNCKMKYSLNEGNLVERMIPRKSIKNVIKNHIPELLKLLIIKIKLKHACMEFGTDRQKQNLQNCYQI